jgi:hypothetical protein
MREAWLDMWRKDRRGSGLNERKVWCLRAADVRGSIMACA